jgi:hypothetical protein
MFSAQRHLQKKEFAFFSPLKQGFTIVAWLAWNSQSSCLSLFSAGITGMNHYTQKEYAFMTVKKRFLQSILRAY